MSETRTTERETRGGTLRRLASRFTTTQADVEAEELRQGSRELGAERICDCTGGELATVRGTIRSVTLRPRGGAPALEAELYDGSGRLRLVWLGRRRIAGIVPGRMLMVSGRVTCNDDVTTMFNPRYELKPLVSA